MVSANIRKDRRRTLKGLTLCCVYSPSTLAWESLYAYVTSPIDIDFLLVCLPPPLSRVLSVNPCVRAAVRLCNKGNRYRFFLVGVPPLPSRMFWNLWLGTINTGWGADRVSFATQPPDGQHHSFLIFRDDLSDGQTENTQDERFLWGGITLWNHKRKVNIVKENVFFTRTFSCLNSDGLEQCQHWINFKDRFYQW